IGRVVFYILAAIRLAILCGYSSVLLLVIVCLDHLSIYIPDFTHFNLHSRPGDNIAAIPWRYSSIFCWSSGVICFRTEFCFYYLIPTILSICTQHQAEMLPFTQPFLIFRTQLQRCGRT
ncbi:MAG: hypothetical protein ACK6CX_07585, partial [Pseudanabaena sp.]